VHGVWVGAQVDPLVVFVGEVSELRWAWGRQWNKALTVNALDRVVN
jgi:hypothetical protein